MANTNCLAGIACPHCGWEYDFLITATVEFPVTDSGTDFPVGHVGWDDESPIRCANCTFDGTVADFTTTREE